MKPAPLKEVIKKEYIKCAKDPVYFMKKYCVVQHPMRGNMNIKRNQYRFLKNIDLILFLKLVN